MFRLKLKCVLHCVCVFFLLSFVASIILPLGYAELFEESFICTRRQTWEKWNSSARSFARCRKSNRGIVISVFLCRWQKVKLTGNVKMLRYQQRGCDSFHDESISNSLVTFIPDPLPSLVGRGGEEWLWLYRHKNSRDFIGTKLNHQSTSKSTNQAKLN